MNDHGRKWAAGLRALIVRRLRDHGPQTTHELANGCQVAVAAVAPRMVELEELGEAHDTGRRRSSASGRGRKQKVWAATGCGVEGLFSPHQGPDLGATPVLTPQEADEPVMRLLA